MPSPQALIPSMFHRRLALLAVLVAISTVGLGVQLGRLTISQGDALRDRAESKLERVTWLPTQRGRVLDRKGRVLADDRPSYDLAVDFNVIIGAWAVERAGRYARRVHRDAWPKLAAQQRRALIDRYLPAYEQHLEAMWETLAAGVDTTPDVLADRRADIESRVDRMFSAIVRARTKSARRDQLAMGREITERIERRIEEQASRPIAEQRSPHVIASRVDDETGFLFQRLLGQTVELMPGGENQPADEVDRLPGLAVRDAGDRHYPFDRVVVDVDRSRLPSPVRRDSTESVEVEGVAIHLLGWMRSGAFAEDIERREAFLSESAEQASTSAGEVLTSVGTDRGRYLPTDAVGSSGLERSAEHRLRGLRGYERYRIDTGSLETHEPEPGRDIGLTIDIALQARIQALLDPELGLARVQPWHGEPNPTMPVGTPINGAAVVLEIDTGDILAMVSTPTFSRDAMRDDPASIFESPIARPALNRALEVPYQPGSIVKAPILVAAATQGLWRPSQHIECTGHFLPGRDDVYRCWIYKRFGTTHGDDLSGEEAIKVSCNIFFYELGRRLGPKGMAEAYRQFGIGESFDLGVGREFEGVIGAFGAQGAPGDRLSPSDVIFMGIGQGPVAWTPLHAAEAIAMLARGGISIRPRLVSDGSAPDVREVTLDRAAIDVALEGLRLSANDPRGTGHHITLTDGTRENIFTAPGVSVWGKTGTAEASPLRADTDGDGTIETLRAGDHSWFVVLVGPEGQPPTHAVAVLMEYAGSGARVSGPVTNQVIHALIDEGYLPDTREPSWRAEAVP